MKKMILYIFFLIIASSCQKENNNFNNSNIENEQIKNKTINNKSNNLVITAASENNIQANYQGSEYKLIISSEIINNFNESNFLVQENENLNEIYNLTVSVDLSLDDYRIFIRGILEDKADLVSNNTELEISELAIISELLTQFTEEFSASVDENIRESDVFQSIFYHNSIYKMILRKDAKSLDNCECATNTKYLNGLSSFFCNEDLIFSSSEVANYYEGRYSDENTSFSDSLLLDSAGIDSVIIYANNNPTADISLKQIEDIMFANSLDSLVVYDSIPNSYLFGRCGRKYSDRSDVGCCGAKAGKVCRMCNFVCAWHDLQCCDCKPLILCFSGCSPGC